MKRVMLSYSILSDEVSSSRLVASFGHTFNICLPWYFNHSYYLQDLVGLLICLSHAFSSVALQTLQVACTNYECYSR